LANATAIGAAWVAHCAVVDEVRRPIGPKRTLAGRNYI
jgi:hypothetical protein